jgi:UDP-glucose 4-epimerase|tara:strand:- start:3383 stop:4402 length:1020 start_codon:yes stop_codon:yes gene_type:complete
MYNSNTKILVTGGAGFIGTNFINDLLNRGHNPKCIAVIDNMEYGTYIPKVHDKIENFHRVDIRNQYIETIIEKFAPEYVYHFAGLVSIYDCHEDPYEAVDNNILGSINVMNGCLKADVKRIIFSETSAVYENCEMPDAGFNEEQSDPTTIYSTTKACLALIAESYCRTKGLNYTALRYFNVAGPLQDYERTVPPVFAGFILRIKGGNNPIVFGDYKKSRDYINVADVNAFHILCMENEDTANQTFNLGTGKMTNLMDLKNLIADAMGVKTEFDHYDPIAGEALNSFGDISKAKSMGWEPKKDIIDTIKETLVYLENEIEEGNINPSTFMEDLEIEKVKI